jgi:drug/metabolite transporter (DMT)-like permease
VGAGFFIFKEKSGLTIYFYEYCPTTYCSGGSFSDCFIQKNGLVFRFLAVPLSAWFGVLFLIFFGSIVAYLSYIWLLSVKPAALVSTHTYINPIVTVIAGWIVANQSINGGQLYGLAIILLGVLLTNVTKYFNFQNGLRSKSEE